MEGAKKLLNTSRKAALFIFCAAVVLLVSGCGSVPKKPFDREKKEEREADHLPDRGQDSEMARQVSQDDGQKNADSQIGLDAARDVALSDAGVSASDVTYTKEKLDYEDGIAVYDIEFYTASYEYEYEINAETGEVYSKDVEAFQSGIRQNKDQEGSDTYISEEEAKSAALTHAGFSDSDVTIVKSKFDTEDGRKVYEIEFYKDGKEYEYTIDAVTGALMGYDMD